MSQRNPPGASLNRRLLARADGGIQRRRMADGGEVISGPIAQRALDAVGARAMTMDEQIFVREDFDANDPVDQALYAHERHHQMESGGLDGDKGHSDHEEMAARAIERMVLHRSKSGEDFGSIMRAVESGAIFRTAQQPGAQGDEKNPDTAMVRRDPTETKDDTEALAAYRALRAAGKTHEAIVRDLAKSIVGQLGMRFELDTLNGRGAGFL